MSSPDIVCLGKKPRTEASAWSFTATKDTKFSFAWTIENFSRKMESYDNGKRLESGIFKVRVEGLETSWELRCYPNGLSEDGSGHVSMFLRSTDATLPKTFNRKLSYSLEILNEEGSGILRNKGDRCTNEFSNGWGWEKFVTHEKLKSDESKLLSQDCFEVFCVMKFDGQEVTTIGASSPTNLLLEQKGEKVGTCCSGLVDLLESRVLANVDLVCEGRTFSCHKAILASKSPVFMATFCNDMKEKATGQIDIKGIKPDMVKDMLTHVYGGKIEMLEDKAEELLVAADRYDLNQLKKSCEGMLARSLNIDNCLDFLLLADRHSPVSLKPVVIKFIVENFLEVVAKDSWMEKMTDFSEVFKEVFAELASLRFNNDKKESSSEKRRRNSE